MGGLTSWRRCFTTVELRRKTQFYDSYLKFAVISGI